jgi:hypothetical protein
MNRVRFSPGPAADDELARVVEPLAHYICATERPRVALMSALGALFHEVEQTHQAALALLTNYSENHWP